MYKLYIAKNKTTKEMLNKYHLNGDIYFNEYGKPYLKNKSLFFNISHSDNYIVLAISNREIGVDIQKITFRKRVINHICTNEEKSLIKTSQDFTKLWVKKESYVKCLGKGLSYGLKNVDTLKLNNIKIKKYKNYYIAICL